MQFKRLIFASLIPSYTVYSEWDLAIKNLLIVLGNRFFWVCFLCQKLHDIIRNKLLASFPCLDLALHFAGLSSPEKLF